MKTKFLHLLIALNCLLIAAPALAGTLTVTSANDSGAGSLRQALIDAQPGDTIIFRPNFPGTILLSSGELVVSNSLTILGPGPLNLRIDAAYNSRVFNIQAGEVVTLSGLTIMNGSAQGATGSSDNSSPNGGPGQGGGIINAGLLTLTNCTVLGNTVAGGNTVFDGGGPVAGDGEGGGIYNSGSLSLVNCEVLLNSAYGGNVENPVGDPSGDEGDENNGPYIEPGNAQGGDGEGGGICSQGYLSIMNCTICSNSVAGGYTDYTFDDGQGGHGYGGGVYIVAGQLANSTIAFNTAMVGVSYAFNDDGSGNGAGICVADTGVSIIGCTISENGLEADGHGDEDLYEGSGIFCANAAVPILENTIVSHNFFFNNPTETFTFFGNDVDGNVSSSGFNLVGDASSSSGWIASDQTGVDPQLGPLQNNGGLTPTMALSPASPAVNKGYSSGLTTDQRGFPRPINYPLISPAAGGDGSDIGAYELFFNPAVTISHQINYMTLSWDEHGGVAHLPFLGLQIASGNLPSGTGHWSAFQKPVRMIANQFVARDDMAAGPVYYELSSAVVNNFIPSATTLSASNIMATSAQLTGSDVPVGSNTLYWFEYGYGTNYEWSNSPASICTSTNPVNLSYNLGGLYPLTLYHCELVVTDDWGIQYGGDQTFNTPGLPPVVTSDNPAYNGGYGSGPPIEFVGDVNGEGTAVAGFFQYGPTTDYGFTSPTVYGPANYSDQVFVFAPTNLPTYYTTWHYRFVAYNGVSGGFGFDIAFTTQL